MSVLLEPVNSNLYSNTNLEPQYVTIRKPNTATIYLDSQDCVLELNKVDMDMSTIKQSRETPTSLASGISRLSVRSVGINYITPNVNLRNNVLTIFSSVSGTTHSVTLPEGFYTTSQILIDAIVTALNTLSGSSGLTFNRTTDIGDIYFLNSVGGNYYFDLNCSAVKYGYQLYALPTDQILNNRKRVGSMALYYTRYIDICSDTLTQFAKLRSATTGNRNDLLVRVFVNNATLPHVIGFYDAVGDNYNFLPSYPLNTIHFTLRDQFGNTLYVPPGADGTAGGFFWDCNLLIET